MSNRALWWDFAARRYVFSLSLSFYFAFFSFPPASFCFSLFVWFYICWCARRCSHLTPSLKHNILLNVPDSLLPLFYRTITIVYIFLCFHSFLSLYLLLFIYFSLTQSHWLQAQPVSHSFHYCKHSQLLFVLQNWIPSLFISFFLFSLPVFSNQFSTCSFLKCGKTLFTFFAASLYNLILFILTLYSSLIFMAFNPLEVKITWSHCHENIFWEREFRVRESLYKTTIHAEGRIYSTSFYSSTFQHSTFIPADATEYLFWGHRRPSKRERGRKIEEEDGDGDGDSET